MREYYLVRVIYKNKELFMIWYSDDIDGFLIYKQKLLTFTSIDEAKLFSEEQHILLKTGIEVYDFTDVFELINNIDYSENCSILLKNWNLLSDLAKSLNKEFLGDSDEMRIIDIYNKLFFGSNLKAINKGSEEYHPIFDDIEIKKCIEVFINGFSILDEQLDII